AATGVAFDLDHAPRTFGASVDLGAFEFQDEQQFTIYVDADAGGAANGSSWTDAYTTLQDALAESVAGQEVWVAAGTYRPDAGAGQTAGDRAEAFRLTSGVEVYGGFSGTETSLDQRDWAAHVAYLSGTFGGAGPVCSARVL